MRRRRAPIALLVLIAAACALPAVQELNAAEAAASDAWSVTVPASTERAYAIVLGVLSDSSYLIQRSDAASGTIETRPRRDRDAARGEQRAEARAAGFDYPANLGASTARYEGSNYPITLRALVQPVGTDSSRVTISGDYAIHNQAARISARSAEWRYVTGVGAAVLSRLGVPQP